MSIHSFPGRPLTLGGIRVPYLFGLQGHSDADVLLHAICDALLGAIAEGDIGRHFPDTDPQYKDIKSTLLLKRVGTKVREKGFRISKIWMQRSLPNGRSLLISSLEWSRRSQTPSTVETGKVNVKATTTEGLGFTGRGEGISAYAVVLIEED